MEGLGSSLLCAAQHGTEGVLWVWLGVVTLIPFLSVAVVPAGHAKVLVLFCNHAVGLVQFGWFIFMNLRRLYGLY